jgi:hypothetical protein
MRASGFRAAFDFAGGDIHGDRGCVAVAHLALAADLLELMAAIDQVAEERARESIFDLDALAIFERIGRIAAGQESSMTPVMML